MKANNTKTLITEFSYLFIIGTFQCGITFIICTEMARWSSGLAPAPIVFGTYHDNYYMILPFIFECGVIAGVTGLAYLHIFACYYIFLRNTLRFNGGAWTSKLKILLLLQTGACIPALLLPLRLWSLIPTTIILCPAALWLTSWYIYLSNRSSSKSGFKNTP